MRFLLIPLLILSFSCTKSKVTDEKVLHLVSIGKVFGFDPALGGDQYSGAEMGKVFEGLFEYHPIKRPYELMPNLAESLPTVSKDGLTYTFKIKKGVLFHDDACFKDGIGRELKASDVIYSIKRLADPKVQSRGFWLFDDRIKGLNEWKEKHSKSEVTNYDEEVPGLKVIDDYTFQVGLKKPYPQLLYSFAMTFTLVVPREAVDTYGKEFINHPVGTGPFRLPKFDQTDRIIYTKNPKYREKYYPSESGPKMRVPLVDKMIVDIMIEDQPRWLSFQKGKIDIMTIPKDYMPTIVGPDLKAKDEYAQKGINVQHMPMLDATFYAFNHADPLFHNLKLRQAMSLAVNREEENRLFYNNTALLAQGPIPPGMSGHQENFKNPYTKYDLELAKKLLKEAGYPDGKGLPEITLDTMNSTVDRQFAESFAMAMSKIGIKAKGSFNTWPALVGKVAKRNFQLYTMGWMADYPDAENFLQLLYCPNKPPGQNGSSYCNPKFDELYRKATILPDSLERTRLYEQLNQMAALDVPWIFSYHRTKFFVNQGWVKNFNPMEFNHTQYQYLGIDVEKKKQMMEKF